MRLLIVAVWAILAILDGYLAANHHDLLWLAIAAVWGFLAVHGAWQAGYQDGNDDERGGK